MSLPDLTRRAGSGDQPVLPILRPARREDAPVIRRLVHTERLNPLALNWQHFFVLEEDGGKITGCIQVKSHYDGSRELASLVVSPQQRGRGLARCLIEAVLLQEPGPLYLTCRAGLESFYARFGFISLAETNQPPYFRRISRLYRLFQRIARVRENLLVMRRNPHTLSGV